MVKNYFIELILFDFLTYRFGQERKKFHDEWFYTTLNMVYQIDHIPYSPSNNRSHWLYLLPLLTLIELYLTQQVCKKVGVIFNTIKFRIHYPKIRHTEYFKMKEFEKWQIEQDPLISTFFPEAQDPFVRDAPLYLEKRRILIAEDGGPLRGT